MADHTSPTVALGVLSSAGAAGTTTTSAYVYRRATVREGLRGFHPSVLPRVAIRFLLAGIKITNSHSNNMKQLRMAHEENQTHGDMVFLNMCAQPAPVSALYLAEPVLPLPGLHHNA